VKTIQQVLQANLCTGCGLCVKTSDDMQVDQHGFIRPIHFIDDQISSVCPGRGVRQNNQDNYNLSWGPILSSNVGHATDIEIRRRGSSGGVITALLTHCLEASLVDAVIQVGRSEINPIQTKVRVITCAQDLLHNAGSRYAPSAPLSVLRSIIGNGETYAFVGKPCDVAALRNLQEKDERLEKQFPYLVSFMCAGVPSQKGTEEILDHHGVSQQELVDFRYRGDGWPGLTNAITKSGDSKNMTYNEAWGRILNRHLQLRCKVCVDGTGESADVVCADAWYESENGYPSFDEKDGRSLILVRTGQGASLLSDAIASGRLSGVEEYNLNNLEKVQPYQYNRKGTLLARQLAMKFFAAPFPHYQGFHLGQLSKKILLKSHIKAFLGTITRKIKGRL